LEGNEELIDAGCEVIQDGWELLKRYVPQFPDRLIDGRTEEGTDRLYRKRYGDDYNRSYVPYEPGKWKRRPRGFQPVREPKLEDSHPHHEDPLPEDLPETEGRVLAVVGSSPIEIDAIIAKTGMEPTVVSTALTMLQIKKRIIKCYGNSYQRL
jgi:predicted Rossmann fold nucleotide-binding protein DprA/Smf involved in DNA uptake